MRHILFVLVLFSFNYVFSQNGTIDSTFNFHAFHKRIIGNVNCVKVQADNKIIIGGNFYTSGSIIKNKLIRIHEDKSLDTNFLAGNSINKPIKDIVLQTDGKIIIVGDFESFDGITANGIIRLNIDGSPDPSFYLGLGGLSTGGFDREVSRVHLQDDGKIIISGTFDVFNGEARRRIARLNIDGTLDVTFDPGNGVTGGSSVINDFVILPNQKIMIGGSFNNINGNSCLNMTRLNSNGSFDNTYAGHGTNNVIFRMSMQGNKIIAVGGFDMIVNLSGGSNYYNPKIARFYVDGTMDLTFSSPLPAGGFEYLKSLYVHEDSTIIIGSSYTGYINKLGINGNNLWTGDLGGIQSYGQPSVEIASIDVNSNGKIVFGGNFNVSINQLNGVDYYMSNGIGFMTNNGYRDLHVGGVGARTILYAQVKNSISLPNDKMLICGKFEKFNNIQSTGLAKLESNGYVDTTFNVGTGFLLNGSPGGEIYSIANQVDGKFIVGGYFTSYQGVPKSGLIRINSDGSLDVNFGSGINFGSFTPYAIKILEDGKYLIAGDGLINNISTGAARKGIFRLNIDGTLDETFYIGVNYNNPQFRSIAVQEDGKIVCGGIFSSINSLPYRHLIRFNIDGSIDTTFNTLNQFGSAYATVEIKSINILPDGKIIVGGNFQSYQNEPRSNIMKLNENASLDTTFNIGTGFNNNVNDIIDQPDGKILVGGSFGMYNGISTPPIVKLMANGSLDTTFIGPNNVYYINHMHFQSDGKIIVSSLGSNSNYFIAPSGLYRINNDSFSPAMEMAISTSSNLDCQNNGVATISPINGVFPFLYSWDSLPPGNNPDLIYFTPGVHHATVIDSTGASESMTLILNGPENDTLHNLKGNLITSFYRPGVITPIFLDWYNQTCDSTSGYMELILDTSLSLSNVTPIPDIIIGDTLRWYYSDLTYNQNHLTAQLEVLTSSNLTIGDSIKINLKVFPIIGDSDSSDNIKNYIFPVLNSYDPNDKKVYPIGDCIPHYIDTNELLTYTVRFQNTGSAEAININILDTIDANLDLSTFKVVAQSHELQVQVLSNNVLNFKFENINLPDSSTNDSGSHGYVVYEILPIDNLQEGTVISNVANIYFDYNPAITTNDVTNTISTGFYNNSIIYLNSTNCDSLSWNGQLIYSSGQYISHLQNVFGCDSSVYINVLMGSTNDTLLIYNVCDSLLLNNNTYYSSGTFNQIIQNSTGCDSNIVIDLTINENTFNNLYITELDSFNFEGITYYESGIYNQIFQNYLGCDSVVIINLSLNYTGLTDNKFEEFLIFPNPTRDHINIKFNELPIETNYYVSDEIGKNVISKNKIENQTESIDLSDLKPGVYFLFVNQINEKSIIKIIKY